jgi:hypothetical protein
MIKVRKIDKQIGRLEDWKIADYRLEKFRIF